MPQVLQEIDQEDTNLPPVEIISFFIASNFPEKEPRRSFQEMILKTSKEETICTENLYYVGSSLQRVHPLIRCDEILYASRRL